MIEDINNRPQLMKNLKQGDKIWYIYYSFRGNGKTKSSISINQYEVAKLDDFYYTSFVINVMRRVHKTCMYDSANPGNIGKVTNNIELDSLCHLYSDDMKRRVVFHSDTTYAYAYVLAFDKEEAINRMKSYIETKATSAKERFESIIEEKKAEFKEIEDEYNNILNTIDNECNRG